MPRAFKKAGTFQRNAWTKMIGKKRYRVHCEDLGLPRELWTELGSYQAAIEHWEKLVAEKSPVLDPINQQLATILDGTTPDELRRLAHQGAEAHRVLAILEAASVDGKPVTLITSPDEFGPIGKAAVPVAELATLPIPQKIITKNLTDGVFDDDEDVASMRLKQVAISLARPKIETVFTLKHHADEFLQIERARMTRANTYGELMDYIGKLVDLIGPQTDARTINEQTVTSINLKLRAKYKTVATRKKVWGFFKRLVRHLWSERLIEMPRNLDEKKFAFKVTGKKVKRYELNEVCSILATLPERLKLYALLALNCGMQGMDMASFTKDQLDTRSWRITRRRTKTEETEDVPEVTYQLWPSTANLLKKHTSDDDTLVLTSKVNTPLLTVWIDENTGKKKKKDLITTQWKRKKLPFTLKAFRSIGATIIGDHKEYGRYYHHFLAHSPKSIGDKHYVPPSDELFDEIMAYVGKQLGLA